MGLLPVEFLKDKGIIEVSHVFPARADCGTRTVDVFEGTFLTGGRHVFGRSAICEHGFFFANAEHRALRFFA